MFWPTNHRLKKLAILLWASYLDVQPVQNSVRLRPLVGDSGVVFARQKRDEVLHRIGHYLPVELVVGWVGQRKESTASQKLALKMEEERPLFKTTGKAAVDRTHVEPGGMRMGLFC